MPKSSDEGRPYDADSPPFTREMMKRAVPFSALSPTLQQALAPDASQAGQAAKEVISIRLSKDVADALRATGSGWQGRLDEHLRDWLHTESSELKKAS